MFQFDTLFNEVITRSDLLLIKAARQDFWVIPCHSNRNKAYITMPNVFRVNASKCNVRSNFSSHLKQKGTYPSLNHSQSMCITTKQKGQSTDDHWGATSAGNKHYNLLKQVNSSQLMSVWVRGERITRTLFIKDRKGGGEAFKRVSDGEAK